MEGDGIRVRVAEVRDIPPMIGLRRMMFESMGFADPVTLAASDAACVDYFARAIPSGQYRGWVAETPEGEVVASGGLVVDRHPPTPENLDGRIAYIMNVATDPAHRRRGLARRIFAEIIRWSRQEGIGLASLQATDMGRSLYEEFGFADGPEMRAALGKEQGGS